MWSTVHTPGEPVMRRRARRDANQHPIVQVLLQAGYSVQDLSAVGGGLTDLLVGGIDRETGRPGNWLLEIKTDLGQLNKRQVRWHDAWRGQKAIVRTGDEALAAVGALTSLENN